MGIYLYTLKTTARRIEVDGEMVDSHLLSFSRRLSTPWDERSRKAQRAYEASDARMTQLWSERPAPRFVVVSRYHTDSHVYGDWPQGRCDWVDTENVPGRFLGHLVEKGRGFALRRWFGTPIPVMDGDKQRQMQEMARGRWFTESNIRGSTVTSTIYCENELDLVTAKLLAC